MKQNYFYKSYHELILSPSEEEMHGNKQTQSVYRQRFKPNFSTELRQSFGPTHISLPFPLHLSILLQEKSITAVKTEIGWLHQGIEKAFEATSWKTGPSFATRTNPLVPAPIALTFILSLEKILQIDEKIQELAQDYRVLMLECARIFHHLNVINQTVSLIAPYALIKLSEKALNMAQNMQTLANHDQNNSPRWQIGGIRNPIYQAWIQQFQREANTTSKVIHNLKRNVLQELQIEKRLTGIGVITKDSALSFGITGPTLRACSIADDLRRSHPYFNYFSYAPAICTQKQGDAWARLNVRFDEIETSFQIVQKIIQVILKEMKGSESLAIPHEFTWNKEQTVLPGMETASIESPEGELSISIVSHGTDVPYRVRLRTPSFFHTAALSVFLKNADIDDVVLIILSLGITGLEVDR
jgi:NADH-quinone oxidoreductase subunit D